MTVSPHIGILTNLHEEHLDHYGTLEKYIQAKRHIYLNQKEEDVLICNVQCLPEPGTCRSKLIAAKPSLKSLYFRSREYLVRELFQKKWSISGKKWEVIQENDTTEARYEAIPLKFLYPRSAF